MVVVMVFGVAVWWRVGCDPRGVCVGVEVGKRREGGRARLRGRRRKGGEGRGVERGREKGRRGEEEGRETRDHTHTHCARHSLCGVMVTEDKWLAEIKQ